MNKKLFTMNTNHRQIQWDDLPYVAILAPLNEQIVQCAIITHEGGCQAAHLFLLTDGLLALTDVNFRGDVPPNDDLLLAIARVQVAHLLACREGRTLL